MPLLPDVATTPLAVPAPHWVHEVDPGTDHDPGGHDAHALRGLEEKLPAPHNVHTTALPEETGTDPGLHAAHALAELEPAGDDWPAPHGKHTVPPPDAKFGFGALYVPMLQVTHASCDDAPEAGLAVPGEHATHAVCARFAYEPAMHWKHVGDARSGGGMLPGAHEKHELVPAAAHEPGRH